MNNVQQVGSETLCTLDSCTQKYHNKKFYIYYLNSNNLNDISALYLSNILSQNRMLNCLPVVQPRHKLTVSADGRTVPEVML